jgi:diguanylate cyclase (GGDEF)-like protein
VQDISAIRRADATIQQQASYDVITGLPNRTLFTECLQWALQAAKRKQQKLAILFIDLDHFKNINDSLGHAVGDALLAEMGRRFCAELVGCGTVARLGGDEFVVMLDETEGRDHCATVAQKLLQLAQQPVQVNDHEVVTSGSIGATFYPEDAHDVESLFQRADQAMYAAKNAGCNTLRFFTQTMQDDATRRHQLHMLLVKALADGAL